jgi:predicted glutamine amidotransferase
MCRFVAYQGHAVLLADLLYRSRHSLVAQSAGAEEMSQTFNGDGFGVGWFFPEIDPWPCIMKAPGPAWSNLNARRMAAKIRSGNVFAHVRAASAGMPVQESNCHPFVHGRLMFMHNGSVQAFHRIRRRLQQSLSDPAFDAIEGNTDSEHAFALVLDELGHSQAEHSPERLRKAAVGALIRLVGLARAAGVSAEMYCNFALTDGRTLVVTRFAHETARPPASLYYSIGERYVIDGDDGDMLGTESRAPGAVMVASEPLTRRKEDWRDVPPNHTLVVDVALAVSLAPIELGTPPAR